MKTLQTSKIYKKIGRIKFYSKSEYDSFLKNKEYSKEIDSHIETKKYKATH